MLIWRERAAQGVAAPQGAAMEAPLIAAASAPEEIRDFAIVLIFIVRSIGCNGMAEMADATFSRGNVFFLTSLEIYD